MSEAIAHGNREMDSVLPERLRAIGDDEIAAQLHRYACALELAVRGLQDICRESEPRPVVFDGLNELAWEVVARSGEISLRADARAMQDDVPYASEAMRSEAVFDFVEAGDMTGAKRGVRR